MKYGLAFVLALLIQPALAASPHWVKVKDSVKTHNGAATLYATVFLDDANRVVDGAYRGFNIKTVLVKPVAAGGIMVKAVISQFVVACRLNDGKGRRMALMDASGRLHRYKDAPWRNIGKPPATETLAIVKQKVCGRRAR